MNDILKITLTFLIMLLLIKRKWNIGTVLISASIILFILYMMPLANIIKSIKSAFIEPLTLQLLISLSFIRMIEMILREKLVLKKMMSFIKRTLRNKRAVAISMPLLIGIMPSLGGAYFSAPMVAEATEGLAVSRELNAYINYWYRHPWELFSPLYPGIILASLISGIPMRTFILMNLSTVITMLIIGMFFGIPEIKGKFERSEPIKSDEILSFIPIIGLILLVLGFNVPTHYALIIVVVILMSFYKTNLAYIKRILLYGFTREIIILILGIMILKETLEVSGAVSNLSLYFSLNHIPAVFILFILPFISGFLTGFTSGFVSSSFPLLISIHGVDAYALSFAFICGYAGVLLSPLHVCLVVTKDYFKADMYGIYKKTIPSVIIIVIVAIIQCSILSHSTIF